MPRKILIAHQSTIPHYRVDFYNTVEAMRPSDWTFEVVFDHSEHTKKRFFDEGVDQKSFQFPVVNVKSYSIRRREKRLTYQTFLSKIANYDLIVVGSALSNISYPLSSFCRFFGIKYAIWGHGRDHAIAQPKGTKFIVEKLRSNLARRADGFFAYTSSVKNYLVNRRVQASKIFILNNTIDIQKQRNYYEKYLPNRESTKERLGLKGKKVLLFIGRFSSNKRINFLLESFSELIKKDNQFHLLMIGSGAAKFEKCQHEQVEFHDSVTDPDDLARFYIASDLYVFPGAVGLGPLQALCYSLPVVCIDSELHPPEFEYLSSSNSLILPRNTTTNSFADELLRFYSDTERLASVRASIWPSISHLTIQQMAINFIQGINQILKKDQEA